MKLLSVILAVVFLAPALSMAGDAEKARIITMLDKPAECLAAVAIKQIDGRQKMVSPLGFDIEPGSHSMSGTAQINVANCPRVRGYRDQGVPPLEADFEAGKTYYVGLDHSSADRTEWALVIWKVEGGEDEG
jgi:hypothetical protein